MITQEKIPIEIIQIITIDQAWNYCIVPYRESDKQLFFYVSENNNENVSNELQVLFGKAIITTEISDSDLNSLLSKYYRKGDCTSSQLFTRHGEFLMDLIQEAYRIRCSDIHIEIFEERCRIRMRIDGKLIERYTVARDIYPSLINKIKIKANLDIAEKRLPQDGRILYSDEVCNFDIRVSVLPALYGEKVVLRLLSKETTQIEIDKLGFSENQLLIYKKAIRKPNGIVLISGPTGSGKTTTLYATLKILNSEACNILTIEDPIEYTLEGINQVQCKDDIGLNFASALRSFLRQDPDIIMLGEIRDSETAQMAIRAALTGHLVFLPQEVSDGKEKTTSYVYSAEGEKLAVLYDGRLASIYAGSHVYDGDGKLDYIIHPEGVVRRTSAGSSYEYFVKDHLGSTRAVVSAGGGALQQVDYYPFGLEFTPVEPSNGNRYLYNGKEQQDGILQGVLDYGFRIYDPQLGRFHSIDPMVENDHHNYTPYAYAYNNPVLFIDPLGLDTTVYFFDQPEQPTDDYQTANYTAEVYVDVDGTIEGPYKGSTYPDSEKDKNTTEFNTLKEGEHDFNNAHGHKGGVKKGLNVVEDKNKTTQANRTAEGKDPEGNDVQMTVVNVHTGYNSRRFSEGCPTIAPSDFNNFTGNFDWSGGNSGNSKGTIVIYRTPSLEKTVVKSYLKVKQWVQENISNEKYD